MCIGDRFNGAVAEGLREGKRICVYVGVVFICGGVGQN